MPSRSSSVGVNRRREQTGGEARHGQGFLKPGDNKWIADAAAVSVLLVARKGVLAAMAQPCGKFE